jgi:hypothetical protein
MRSNSQSQSRARAAFDSGLSSWKASFLSTLTQCVLIVGLLALGGRAGAQVNVLTAHNDIARDGQNLNETILTPGNVKTQFGKLFTQPILGPSIAQPLYVANVPIAGKGTHNVIYVASSNAVYAFDADDNGGTEAKPLWQLTLISGPVPVGTGCIQQGVFGTPVIDPPSATDPSGTIYLVSTYGDLVNNCDPGTNFQYQLHALDITSGAEKFGGPVEITASVPGTGYGSTGGVLAFNPDTHQQRPGLLLLNGVVYVAFGSKGDIGSWHGWIMSYNAKTLQQIDVFCTTPSVFGGGLWAGGAALAAEVNDPTKPYGRMFVATGNGNYSAVPPFNASQGYSMSVINFDLTNGKLTPEDIFTPYNEATLEVQDGDLGSGAPVLLPAQTTASGQTLQTLVQIGKSGMVYILNRNDLGGYNADGDKVVQEFQTPIIGSDGWGAGVWGTESYWNGNIYYGGQNAGLSHPLTAYSFAKGVISTEPTSQTTWDYGYPTPATSVSSNGNTNGILWVLHQDDYANGTPAMLQAYDATNLGDLLYSTETNFARDDPGPNAKYATPTIANGKVYITSGTGLSVYGLLADSKTAAAPVISPAGGNFTGSESVTIYDTTPNAQIYYTTDGSTPTASSNLYTGPFTVNTSETITAIASASSYIQSSPVSATFYGQGDTTNPQFSVAPGAYTGTQVLTLSDSTNGALIYYTLDGTTPTTSSNLYAQALNVRVSETVNAMAIGPKLSPSSIVSAAYTITPPYAINLSGGFAESLENNQMQFNGDTDLDDIRLQLTNGGLYEAGSAFFKTPVNVQQFTTDITFQLSNPVADGITFTLQNVGPTAVGQDGGALGYAGIGKSVAIKFDLHNNAGEGSDSTGLYVNGELPTVPAMDLTNTPINLHSGDTIDAHLTYDGAHLYMTLTDMVTLGTWSASWAIDIPSIVGGNTAYAGFTGGSGGSSASQKILAWTYLPGAPIAPNYPVGFDSLGVTMNGSAMVGSALQLTSGGTYQTHSAYFSQPVGIDAFTTSFDFQMAQAEADGFTFVMQTNGITPVGDIGVGGGLGYEGIPNSAAIKFDIHNNAGEGNDSTGFYTNGAAPTVPAINLTPSGMVLSNGDSFHVVITYSGTTLTWTISDNNKPLLAPVTNSVTANLATILDGNTAYVGFTAASGGEGAVQNILDWTFTEAVPIN